MRARALQQRCKDKDKGDGVRRGWGKVTKMHGCGRGKSAREEEVEGLLLVVRRGRCEGEAIVQPMWYARSALSPPPPPPPPPARGAQGQQWRWEDPEAICNNYCNHQANE